MFDHTHLHGHVLAQYAPCQTVTMQEEEGANRRGYARYVKKKKLDSLETYVPSVLQARLQLETAGRVMSKLVQLPQPRAASTP